MDELRKALEGIFEESVQDTQLPSLAGPIDVIQILFNPVVQGAVGAAGSYLALKIADKAVDKALDQGWEKIINWIKNVA